MTDQSPRMVLPEMVTVGPLIYRVVEVPDLKDDTYDLGGQIDFQELEIRFRPQRAARRMFVEFWHECLHAACDVAGITMSERNVDALAPVLAKLVLDNPVLAGSYEEVTTPPKKAKATP